MGSEGRSRSRAASFSVMIINLLVEVNRLKCRLYFLDVMPIEGVMIRKDQ